MSLANEKSTLTQQNKPSQQVKFNKTFFLFYAKERKHFLFYLPRMHFVYAAVRAVFALCICYCCCTLPVVWFAATVSHFGVLWEDGRSASAERPTPSASRRAGSNRLELVLHSRAVHSSTHIHSVSPTAALLKSTHNPVSTAKLFC